MASQTMLPEWRVCNRFPQYEVSDYGQVRRGERLMTLSVQSIGYLYVTLSPGDGRGRKVYAHRLVAEAFIGPAPSRAHEVNHINGIKTDNRVCNLEWVTHAENMAADRMPGRPGRPARSGVVLTEDDVMEIHTAYWDRGERQVDLRRRFRVSQPTISHIITGRLWGRVWHRYHGVDDPMARKMLPAEYRRVVGSTSSSEPFQELSVCNSTQDFENDINGFGDNKRTKRGCRVR